MEVKVFSDRVRTSPRTGQVIARDLPTSEAARSLEAGLAQRRLLRAPRGGVASFQVLVSAARPGDGADIAPRLSAFHHGGRALPEAQVFYQYPCQIADDEWTFEALLPLEVYRQAPPGAREGPLGPRIHHAYWVDVPIPRDAAPGNYQGKVGVGDADPLEVTVEVVDPVLPLTPRITAGLNAYSEAIARQHHPGLTGDEAIACERSYYREAHDNRSVLQYLPYDHSGEVAEGYAPPLVGRGRNLRVVDWSDFDRRFGPLFDGTAMAGSPGGERPLPHWYLPFNYHWPADFAHFGSRGYEFEWAEVMAQFRRHFQERGWTHTNFEVYFNHKKRYRYFPWDGDERKHASDRQHFLYFRSLLDRARSIAGAAGAAARIVYRTDISWSYAQDVVDDQIGPLFDLWVASQGNFSWTRYGLDAIHARSQLAWWYGGCGGPERPTMDPDRQVILCWRRGADGFLPNWLCMADDRALDRADPLSFLYPGRRFGWPRALGSIRLRRLRLGTETADLLEMLGRRGRDLVDLVAEAREEDWWTPTPAWTLWPPEVMNNDMYGWQPVANPLRHRDPHTPALVRERALDLLLGREQQ
jgi:hypothetical protein